VDVYLLDYIAVHHKDRNLKTRRREHPLFDLQALCVHYIGQVFRYSPENAFLYCIRVFNQQIYFII